jgi:Fe2+ or Zn2+ uptake regulation protein
VTTVDNIALFNLRRDGQRLTSGRQLLLRTLAEAAKPLTIPMILRAEPSLAQSSVYRNLAVLGKAGLVIRISIGDEHAHFELSEALTGVHHHHLVCTECGSVQVVELPERAERSLDKQLQAAAADTSFQLTGHRLDLIGVCAECTASPPGRRIVTPGGE